MRALTSNEMAYVSGGWDNYDDPLHTNYGSPYGTGFGSGPAPGSSTGGNGSGNNGISPGLAQTLTGGLTILGAATDPLTAAEAGDTADAAHKAQQYNQSMGKAICEGPDQGTWDPNANNGGGGCVFQ